MPTPNSRKRLVHVVAGSVAMFVLPVTMVHAQTCASPTNLISGFAGSGDTCQNHNNFVVLANGALGAAYPSDVWLFSTLTNNVQSVTVTPTNGGDFAVFLCRAPCGSLGTCVAVADAGGFGAVETAPVPVGPGSYYVIVQSLSPSGPCPTCGTYQISRPLDD